MQKFILLLVFEMFAVVVAMLSFRLFSDRLLAGAVAGTVFVLVGLVIFVMGLRSALFRRTFTFALGCVHLFFVAIPLMTVRFLNTALVFQDVKIWGLSGPEFHRISGIIYWALMISALIDATMAWRRKQKISSASGV